MRSKITTERIEEGQLFFHPANIQEHALREFKIRLKKYLRINSDLTRITKVTKIVILCNK